MVHNNRKVKVLVVAFLLLAFPSWAKNLYVNGATGSDVTTYANNDSDNPWLTVTKACAEALAGDNVYVTAGTYSAAGTGDRKIPAFNPTSSGTSGNPITFKAVGTVTLTLSSSTGPVYGAYTKDYITWDGFTTDESDHTMHPTGEPSLAVIWAANNIVIKNGTFLGSGYYEPLNMNRAAIFLSGGNDSHVYNNTFSNFSGADENNADIYLYGSKRNIIEHNTHSDGVSAFWSKGSNAEVTNEDNIFRYNLISGMSRAGMTLGPSAVTTQVYQNIVYDSAWGITSRELPLLVFSNNTIVNSSQSTWGFIRVYTATESSQFLNNLMVYSPSGYGSSGVTSPGTIVSDNNMYFGITANYHWNDEGGGNQSFAYWQSTWGKDANSSYADPLFVDNTAHNYHLQAGSPALTASDTGGPVGAYITGTETIGTGAADTTPAAFSFTDNTGVALSTVIYSTSIQVTGIDNTTSITSSGTGCSYQVNGAGSWLTTGGDNVALNDNVALRVTSSGSYSTNTPCVLTLNGNVSDTWNVTTLAAVSDPQTPRFRGSSMSGGWR